MSALGVVRPSETDEERDARLWNEGFAMNRCVLLDRRDKRGRLVGRQLISPRRHTKRKLMREHGVTSGRQWRKLKKQLRRARDGGA